MSINEQLLHKLLQTFGPSGNEELICEVIREEIKDYVDEIKIDQMGNLIGIKKGNGKKIMIASHMDEIGIIATGIDDHGFIRFSNIGGVSPNVSLGQRVKFKNGTTGVIYMEALDHIKDLKLEKMYIDIGVDSKEKAQEKINIGDVACFDRSSSIHEDVIVSKALDDRIACYIAIETLKQLKNNPHELYFVFTVQEELGLRGAKAAAFGINPDLAIAIDVTGTGDAPKAKHMAVSLRKGPAIKIKDNSIICHPWLKIF